MYEAIIVGAGPVGLYLALKLHKAGVYPLLVIDPRAGDYTREGIIHPRSWDYLKKEFPMPEWIKDHQPRIRNLERAAWTLAVARKIEIRKTAFVRFEAPEGSPSGIVMQEGSSDETFVPCRHVFDCSGAKRVVIGAVNALADKPAFPITPVLTASPVESHMLVNVQIEDPMLYTLATVFKLSLPTEAVLELLLELHALGWKEFRCPEFSMIHVRGNKYNIYLEKPAGLSPSQERDWLSLNLKIRAHGKAVNWHETPSRPDQAPKSRFRGFRVAPQRIDRYMHVMDPWPTVVAHGDAVIEPDYRLGIGMYNAMERVDAFINHAIHVSDGRLDIDASAYTSTTESLIKPFIQKLQEKESGLQNENIAIMSALITHLRNVPEHELTPPLQALSSVLELRMKALTLGSVSLNYATLVIRGTPIHDLTMMLQELPGLTDLLESELPTHCLAERKALDSRRAELPMVWKAHGEYCFERKAYPESIYAYQQSLHLLREAQGPEKEILLVTQNLLIAHKAAGQIPQALEFGIMALNIAMQNPVFSPIREKIFFHLVEAACQYAEEGRALEESCFCESIALIAALKTTTRSSVLSLLVRELQAIQDYTTRDKAPGAGSFFGSGLLPSPATLPESPQTSAVIH